MASSDTIKSVPPRFQLTSRAFSLVSRIDQALGRLRGLAITQPQPLLRKRNRVRSVQASAAIEGNPLTTAQVTALLDGKRVVGRERDLREILNVNEAYEHLDQWVATSRKSLLEAHATLMRGLLPHPGRFRTSGVGVFRGEKLAHLAPPAHLVSHHIDELLRWLRRSEAPALVAGCVVHYELLFIHPFADGNGRIARLWQHLVHRSHSPLLQFIPVESLIRDRQRSYYRLLRQADTAGDCTAFVEFSLGAVAHALDAFGEEVRPVRATAEWRLKQACLHFGRQWFSRGDYLKLHLRLSTATASRDLAMGVAGATLQSRGAFRLTEYRARSSAATPGALALADSARRPALVRSVRPASSSSSGVDSVQRRG
jgi:Fic family protein